MIEAVTAHDVVALVDQFQKAWERLHRVRVVTVRRDHDGP
jgi:hypothetical protein